jgi:hypothetical protein
MDGIRFVDRADEINRYLLSGRWAERRSERSAAAMRHGPGNDGRARGAGRQDGCNRSVRPGVKSALASGVQAWLREDALGRER